MAFTTRLTNRVTDLFTSLAASKNPAVLKALGAMSSHHAAASLTPGAVNQMPDFIRNGIIEAYVNSLTPLFLWMAPMVAAAGLLAFLLKDVPLSHHTGLQMRAASEAKVGASQESPAAASDDQENLSDDARGDLSDGLTGASARRATDVMKVEAAPPRRSAGSDQPAQV